MTTELFWLTLTAILAASLWIPFVVGVNMVPEIEGEPDYFVVPPDPLKLPPWIARSYRAHQNLLEQLMPFAAIVLIGHALGVSNGITAWCATLFFWLRLAHAIGMITAWARMPWRPLIFTAGWVVTMVYAWQVLLRA
ncbi:MAG: MAPEG family protein [Sphingomonas sp.]